MSDFEKHRAQTDARRAVVRRRTGSVVAEQAILRHLGVELYRERRKAERPPDDAGKPTDDEPVGRLHGSVTFGAAVRRRPGVD